MSSVTESDAMKGRTVRLSGRSPLITTDIVAPDAGSQFAGFVVNS